MSDMSDRLADVLRLAGATAAIGAVTALYTRFHVSNGTIVALSFLLIVLVVATTARLWVAVTTSAVAMLCFNFFFLPPVGTWTIADPQNWVVLFAFLAASLIASNLSSVARTRTHEALSRRDELARLFDLSRDVLLMTDSREAITILARSVSRRFDLGYLAIALPRSDDWELFEAGPLTLTPEKSQLSLALSGAEATLEFDASSRTYAGHRITMVGEHAVRLVPLRVGTRPIGLLASAGRPIEAGTLDALAGIVAMAVERIHFLDERKTAELAKRSEELKSALLASLAHDLRTPLTAIRVAATNIRSSWATEDDRQEQGAVILTEVERLTRLFENILEMARIDAGAVNADLQWVQPSEIVSAARDQVHHALREHEVEVEMGSEMLVRVDPRITATAVAHLLENAAQYSPPQSTIRVSVSTPAEGLVIKVGDSGPGIPSTELPYLFDRFYRGSAAKARPAGTGMGLSIARGLLAAENGRIWAENHPGQGAEFTIAVSAERKPAMATSHS